MPGWQVLASGLRMIIGIRRRCSWEICGVAAGASGLRKVFPADELAGYHHRVQRGEWFLPFPESQGLGDYEDSQLLLGSHELTDVFGYSRGVRFQGSE